MILDNVLQEDNNENSFDQNSMVDMFVEGFLYALEMQENGEKASSMEDLSDKLSEAANETISEGPLAAAIAIGSAPTVGLAIYGKMTRKMIKKILATDKYKNNKFASMLKSPGKNKIQEYAIKILAGNILYLLEVDDKDRKDARKFMRDLLADANKEFNGIVNYIDISMYDSDIDDDKNKVCFVLHINSKDISTFFKDLKARFSKKEENKE